MRFFSGAEHFPLNLFKNYKVDVNNKFYNPILFSFVRKKKEYIVYILILFSFFRKKKE